jgi:hypothetical protein
MAQVIEINDGDTVNVIEVQLPYYGGASAKLEFGARATQTLAKGDVVYVSGATGTHIQVTKAQANSEATSAGTIGLATSAASTNADLQVITFGLQSGLDTSAFTAGQVLYLSPSVAGGVTSTFPAAPNHGVKIGWVVRSHPSLGEIFVEIQNYQELDELSDVNVTSKSDGQVLTWNAATSTWVAASPNPGDITAVNVTSPITGGGTSGAVTVGIDQTALSLTASQISDGSTTWARLAAANTFTVGGHLISNAAAAVIPLTLKGAASQSVDLFQIQDSGGTAKFRVLSGGRLFSQATSVGDVTLTLRGVASQTANLQEWQNSAGSIVAMVDAFGGAAFGGNNAFGASLGIGVAGNPAQKAIVVRGAASQSANLQDWQNSSATILARVDALGQFTAPQYSTNNNLVRLAEASSGGFLRLARMTAQAASPGANIATLYFRDGTNPSTVKLVVRAGAAGAETTVLDNIPT